MVLLSGDIAVCTPSPMILAETSLTIEDMVSDLEAGNHFAHPCSSWDRGVKDKANGPI